MNRLRARLILSAVCLVLGYMLVSQIRSLPTNRAPAAQAPADQALYISQLYRNNEAQEASLAEIQAKIAEYEQTASGASNLVSLLDELRQLRMINGEVDVAGPGVRVQISGAQNSIQVLQDLTNELRNAGAEAIAVNKIRLVTRSMIAEDAGGRLLIDGQPVVAPYLLEAIGDPATLETALDRKGGLIALLEEGQGSTLDIKVTRRADGPDGIKLPRTAVTAAWRYARAVPDK
jgi:uncharacterized protein YlxW (UPF0749 family)